MVADVNVLGGFRATLFENNSESCPFGHQLWPGKAQV